MSAINAKYQTQFQYSQRTKLESDLQNLPFQLILSIVSQITACQICSSVLGVLPSISLQPKIIHSCTQTQLAETSLEGYYPFSF